MNLSFRLKHNIKLQLFLASAGILLLYKLFFFTEGSFFSRFFNEAIVFFTLLFMTTYANDVFSEKKITPLSLVMNLGILSAVIFIAVLRSEEHTSELQSRENLVYRLLLEKNNDTS